MSTAGNKTVGDKPELESKNIIEELGDNNFFDKARSTLSHYKYQNFLRLLELYNNVVISKMELLKLAKKIFSCNEDLFASFQELTRTSVPNNIEDDENQDYSTSTSSDELGSAKSTPGTFIASGKSGDGNPTSGTFLNDQKKND